MVVLLLYNISLPASSLSFSVVASSQKLGLALSVHPFNQRHHVTIKASYKVTELPLSSPHSFLSVWFIRSASVNGHLFFNLGFANCSAEVMVFSAFTICLVKTINFVIFIVSDCNIYWKPLCMFRFEQRIIFSESCLGASILEDISILEATTDVLDFLKRYELPYCYHFVFTDTRNAFV